MTSGPSQNRSAPHSGWYENILKSLRENIFKTLLVTFKVQLKRSTGLPACSIPVCPAGGNAAPHTPTVLLRYVPVCIPLWGPVFLWGPGPNVYDGFRSGVVSNQIQLWSGSGWRAKMKLRLCLSVIVTSSKYAPCPPESTLSSPDRAALAVGECPTPSLNLCCGKRSELLSLPHTVEASWFPWRQSLCPVYRSPDFVVSQSNTRWGLKVIEGFG